MKKTVISILIAASLGMTSVPFTAFAEADTRISTYTVRFLDFDGNYRNRKVAAFLDDLKSGMGYFKFLGNYSELI